VNAVELFRAVSGEVESGTGIVVCGNLLKNAALALVKVKLRNAGKVVRNHSRRR
jgi:hypothetical protein